MYKDTVKHEITGYGLEQEDDQQRPNRPLRHLRRQTVVAFILFLITAYILSAYTVFSTSSTPPGPLSHTPTSVSNDLQSDRFKSLIHISHLSPKHLPGGRHDTTGKRRLVFVGDIHGCATELHALLKAVAFNKHTDHLVHTGDVLAKGPDSAGVIDALIDLGASGVRGNWEDRVLLEASRTTFIDGHADEAGDAGAAAERQEGVEYDVFSSTAKTAPDPAAAAKKHRKQKSREAGVLDRLKKHHLRYLHSLPLILRIPPLSPPSSVEAPPESPEDPAAVSGAHREDSDGTDFNATALAHGHRQKLRRLRSPGGVLVVHAGLVPSVPLEKQDPYAVLNMRFLDPETLVPSSRWRDGAVRWSGPWGEWQRNLTEGSVGAEGSKDGVQVKGGVARQGREPERGVGDSSWVDVAKELSASFLEGMREGEWEGVGADGEQSGHGRTEEEKKTHEEPTTVVYGHNAKDGVRMERWTMGLDGGCVSGGRLTAVTLDAWGRREVISVKCKNYLD